MQAKNILYAACMALVMAACNSVDFKKTKGGVPYKIFPSKSGTKIADGNFVKFNFQIKTKDSVINTSYGKMPGYQPVSATAAGPAAYDLGSAINEILINAKKGDSVFITLSADSLLAKDPTISQQLPIKKGDKLNFTLKILDVFANQELVQADYAKEQEVFVKKAQAEQDQKFRTDPKIKQQMDKDAQLIENYLATNNINAKKVGSGTYVQVVNPGTAPFIEKGKFVTMFYNGTTLAGKQFETNFGKEPATFPMQGSTIKGFEEGLLGLGKGARAKIFIPSMLAYGEQSRSEVIGAFENLVFDVQIVDVTNEAPQRPAPGNVDPHGQH